MRIPVIILAAAVLGFFGHSAFSGVSQGASNASGHSSGPNPTISVWYSPHGGCTDAVVDAVDHAKSTVLVQAYSFTSAPIAKALKDAHDRGVDVRVILDKSQRTERYSGLTYLQHAEIPTWIDATHAIAHNKVMVIDAATVVTGSFNFTKSAESSNAENLLVIHDASLAKSYAENWEAHRAHSEMP